MSKFIYLGDSDTDIEYYVRSDLIQMISVCLDVHRYGEVPEKPFMCVILVGLSTGATVSRFIHGATREEAVKTANTIANHWMLTIEEEKKTANAQT